MKGRTGITVDDFNERQGSPTAYMGMAIPEFPNYFTILGKWDPPISESS